MNIFWIQSTVFCPLDNGFLKREHSENITILTCPKCKNKFIPVNCRNVPKEMAVSDGFIKPERFARKHNTNEQICSIILKMEIQREIS